MISVNPSSTLVKRHACRRGPGQPSKQTPTRIKAINRALVRAALTCGELPPDIALATAVEVSERTVCDIRLRTLGLNRHELERWRRQSTQALQARDPAERELVCTTPFAGLWLLVPQIIDAGLAQAAHMLQIVECTRVQAI